MTFEFHKNEEGKASFALKQNFWVNVRKPCFFCFLSMKKKVIKKAEQKKVNKWRLNSMEYSRPPHLLSRLLKSRRLIYMTRLDILLIIDNNLHRCLLYTYSIDIWPARNSRQRETNHYIARCASVLTWSYFAWRWPEQLFIHVDLFAQHHRSAVCYPYWDNVCKPIDFRRLEN